MITYLFEKPLTVYNGKNHIDPILPEDWEHGFIWEGDGHLELKNIEGVLVWGKILTKWGWWIPQEAVAQKGQIYLRPYKVRYMVLRDMGDGPGLYSFRLVRETDKFIWMLNKDGTERKRAKEREGRTIHESEQDARNEVKWKLEEKMVSLRRQLEGIQSQLSQLENLQIIDT